MAATRLSPTSRIRVSGSERAYFGAVAVLALWVGVWGFFVPDRVVRALPFTVPPLHARFLGAMYLSGVAIMVGSMASRSWEDVRVAPVMTALWTGGLGLISFLHLGVFPFERAQTWVWFGAYVAYPLIALWLVWAHGGASAPPAGAPLPRWARTYLTAQGWLLVVLSAFLLLAPGFMAARWPWPITSLLAQIYSAPFLSYGVGSLLMARRRTWPEVRVPAIGMLVFAAGVLVASGIHRGLFDLAQGADLAWFALFAAATVALGLLSASALRRRAAGAP